MKTSALIVATGLCLIGCSHKPLVDTPVDKSVQVEAKREHEVIKWQPSFERAAMQASYEKKPLFVYFHASWCEYCIIQEQNTFKDEKLVKLLNSEFIAVNIDNDTSEDFKVDALPTIVMVYPDDVHSGRKLEGFVDAPTLVKWMQDFLKR